MATKDVTACLAVLLTYLSRLYTAHFKDEDASGEKLLLKKFQAKIDACFRQSHEVADYASLLHISAGHFSEVVKSQSGKPAIKHIHERLVMEARRLLFHTGNIMRLSVADAAARLVKAAMLGPHGLTGQFFNDYNSSETGISPW